MRTLRLRKEVLAQLTDAELLSVAGGQPNANPLPRVPRTGLKCIVISGGPICFVTPTS